MRILFSLFLATFLPCAAFQLPADSSQCIVAIADNWNSSTATLSFHEKKDGKWVATQKPWSARLGKSGLAWGRGIHPLPSGATLKKEGDMRSPAGVFDLGGAWGNDAKIKKHPKLFYRQVTSRDLWVEDPESPQYNRNIILDHEPASAWEKKQQMKQNDYPHSLKLFIAHNAPPRVVPGGGSSIFFHIWRGGGSKPTAGCTTMSEERLRWLIANIDPDRRPVFVLLTKADYEKYRGPWKLP